MKKIVTCLCAFVSAVPAAIAADGVISRVVPSESTASQRAVSNRSANARGATSATRRERDTAVNRTTSSVRARTTTTPTAVRTSDAQPRSERGVNTRDAASARTATTNASRSAVARTSANIQNRVATTNASRAAANRATGAQTQSRATTARNTTRNAATRAGNTVHSRAGVLSRMFSATRKVDTEAAKSLKDTIASMEDDKQITDFCKSQYVSCMDNFCNVLDDEQGRCSCSKNLKNYAKSEAALKQANELLQDVAQQIQYIGLTRDEVETLFTQTAAEQAMQGVTDNSQIKTQLDKIYDMMVDVKPTTATATDVADNGLSLDLDNLLDFTIDSTGFDLLSMFSPAQTSTSISNQRGDQLYKTAAARCRATVLDVCSKQGVDTNLITNAYDLEIDKSCIAYERTLTDGNTEMRQTVRNAQNVLQRARLMVRQQKNTYDLRGCVTALDSCMQDEFVCGADYENCLDPSGKYIVNGAVVVGSTPGQPVIDNYQLAPGYTYDTDHLYATWNYGGKNAWTEDGSLVGYISDTVDGLPTETSEEMSAFLQYKIGYHDGDTDRNYGMCMSVLNKCQDITYTKDGEYIPDNAVVKEYLQRTLTQIKVRQDQLLSAYAESCITDVKSCLTQNSYDTTQNIAINACRQQIVTCMSVTGDAAGEPTPSIISQWVDDVQNGVNEKKLCQRSGGTWQSNGTCSCSSSKGLELSGSACVCSNNGTWNGSECVEPQKECKEDDPVSGCKCNLKTITVKGTQWCVSSSTKREYDACNGTWDTTSMTCESSTGGGNEGGDDSGDASAKNACETGGVIKGDWSNGVCTCRGANVTTGTSNGYTICKCATNYYASNNSCVYQYAQQKTNCESGVKGSWSMSTHRCTCPANSTLSNTKCECKDGYEYINNKCEYQYEDEKAACANGEVPGTWDNTGKKCVCGTDYESDGNGGCKIKEQGGQDPENPDTPDVPDTPEKNDQYYCENYGVLHGEWDETNKTCKCPDGATWQYNNSYGFYQCGCAAGYSIDGTECKFVENTFDGNFTVKNTFWDSDNGKTVVVASDTDTGICYATVVGKDGHTATASNSCIVDCDIAAATANVCDKAVLMTNASSTLGYALYATRNAVNGGIELSFGNTTVTSLYMALKNNAWPANIDWVKNFTDGTDYKLLYAVNSDGGVLYDADGKLTPKSLTNQLDLVFIHKDSAGIDGCEGGTVKGEWDFVDHMCDCESSQNKTNNDDYTCKCMDGFIRDGNGGCKEIEQEPSVTECAENSQITDCECKYTTVDGWCYTKEISDKYDACKSGDYAGTWDYKKRECSCADPNSTQMSYRCVCNYGYVSDGNGGCVENIVIPECEPNTKIHECNCSDEYVDIDIAGVSYCYTEDMVRAYQQCSGSWNADALKCICQDGKITNDCTCPNKTSPTFDGLYCLADKMKPAYNACLAPTDDNAIAGRWENNACTCPEGSTNDNGKCKCPYGTYTGRCATETEVNACESYGVIPGRATVHIKGEWNNGCGCPESSVLTYDMYCVCPDNYIPAETLCIKSGTTSTEEHPINYELNGGVNDPNNPDIWTAESGTVKLQKATREHYVFEGWYLDADFTQPVTQLSADVFGTGILTLYAKFVPEQYSLIFDGLPEESGIRCSYGETVTLPDVSMSGYSFYWIWNGEQVAPGTTVTCDTDGMKEYVSGGGIYRIAGESNVICNAVTFDLMSGLTLYKRADDANWYSDSKCRTQIAALDELPTARNSVFNGCTYNNNACVDKNGNLLGECDIRSAATLNCRMYACLTPDSADQDASIASVKFYGVTNNKCVYTYVCATNYHVDGADNTVTTATSTSVTPVCVGNTITVFFNTLGGVDKVTGTRYAEETCTYGGASISVFDKTPTRANSTFIGWERRNKTTTTVALACDNEALTIKSAAATINAVWECNDGYTPNADGTACIESCGVNQEKTADCECPMGTMEYEGWCLDSEAKVAYDKCENNPSINGSSVINGTWTVDGCNCGKNATFGPSGCGCDNGAEKVGLSCQCVNGTKPDNTCATAEEVSQCETGGTVDPGTATIIVQGTWDNGCTCGIKNSVLNKGGQYCVCEAGYIPNSDFTACQLACGRNGLKADNCECPMGTMEYEGWCLDSEAKVAYDKCENNPSINGSSVINGTWTVDGCNCGKNATFGPSGCGCDNGAEKVGLSCQCVNGTKPDNTCATAEEVSQCETGGTVDPGTATIIVQGTWDNGCTCGIKNSVLNKGGQYCVCEAGYIPNSNYTACQPACDVNGKKTADCACPMSTTERGGWCLDETQSALYTACTSVPSLNGVYSRPVGSWVGGAEPCNCGAYATFGETGCACNVNTLLDNGACVPTEMKNDCESYGNIPGTAKFYIKGKWTNGACACPSGTTLTDDRYCVCPNGLVYNTTGTIGTACVGM